MSQKQRKNVIVTLLGRNTLEENTATGRGLLKSDVSECTQTFEIFYVSLVLIATVIPGNAFWQQCWSFHGDASVPRLGD